MTDPRPVHVVGDSKSNSKISKIFLLYAERNANGEQGTRARKCTEGDCERRKQQKRTLFTRTIVGLIEPERLVKVRRAGAIGSARGHPQRGSLQWEGPRDPTGSQMLPVGKKYDVIIK